MTELLSHAFAEAAKLSPAAQDEIAHWLMVEIQTEQAWVKALADSHEKLGRMAADALAEYSAGLTQDLDPERL